MSGGTADQAIEALRSAIDALAEVDVDQLSAAELDAFVVAHQRHAHQLAAAAAPSLARWDALAVWAGDGSKSAAARLARAVNCKQSSAGRSLGRARALRSMPATAAAITAGELSMDHVDLFANAAAGREAVFAEHEAGLAQQCATVRFTDAVRVIDYWCQLVDADGCEDEAERRREHAHLHASTTLDGEVVLSGVLDPIGGAIVTGELDRLEHELYLADQRDGVIRTASQRRAAALVEMATRSAAMPTDGRRPAPRFTVLLGDKSFERLCELSTGTVITPGQLIPYLGTAEIESILFDGPSTVLTVSDKRTFTGKLRRAIQVRDRRCGHRTGCDVPAERCDVDHIVPHVDDGPTSQFNGRIRCATHNRHPDKRDPGEPLPERPIHRLDALRALIRWRQEHYTLDEWRQIVDAERAAELEGDDAA